jgi:hypothetical protein
MPSLLETIKARIGVETYSVLERMSEAEVALAIQMPLRDRDDHEQYYAPRFLLGKLFSECESFERVGLKILPTDIVSVLFRCKLLFAVKTELEYNQRVGGGSLFGNAATRPKWSDRTEKASVLIDRCITGLETEIRERTLLTEINSFTSADFGKPPQMFFEELFADLGLPFVCFFEGEHLIDKHKVLEPRLRSYGQTEAKDFFLAPSMGHTTFGSRDYCLWYSTMWLRTFLNLLRIAGYIHPGQVDFSLDTQMLPPSFPVFLGEYAQGTYRWDQDKEESWAKIPDGSLFRSFGYRGLSKMWLDIRSYSGVGKFILKHKTIFELLKNPWNQRNLKDIAPTLDILSSATQIPDLGAKILLIHCCLEHLFVPKGVNTENKKYIIGGMHALGPPPHLMQWFDELYRQRGEYARRGFVLKDDVTLSLVRDSMQNVMTLLVAKLSVS